MPMPQKQLVPDPFRLDSELWAVAETQTRLVFFSKQTWERPWLESRSCCWLSWWLSALALGNSVEILLCLCEVAI